MQFPLAGAADSRRWQRIHRWVGDAHLDQQQDRYGAEGGAEWCLSPTVVLHLC